jgi:hypothetical protein
MTSNLTQPGSMLNSFASMKTTSDRNDRFIASRGLEITNNFDTKAEIFA